MGSPIDFENFMTAVIHKNSFDKIVSYIEKAKADNEATILIGGDYDDSKGYFISPTVIITTNPKYTTMTEEIFGPLVTLHKFTNEDKLLKMVNNTRYGLAGSIWTEDLVKGRRIAELIHTGMIWVNTWLHRDLRVPFGGVKDSGVGREGGKWSLNFFSEVMNVCIKDK